MAVATVKIFSNKVYEQRGLDSDMAGDTGQKNKQIHNQNKIIQIYITPRNRQIL